MHLTFLWTLIAFTVISILLFFCIIFFFYKNKKCAVKENNLKKEYNKLIDYNFSKINIPIEHIGFSDTKYECISDYFNRFANEFSNNLEDLKDKILKLPNTLKVYDWKNFNTFYESSMTDINAMKVALINFWDKYKNIVQFRNYLGYIFVSYRENSKKIISFYEQNLNLTYDDSGIKNTIVRIKELAYKLSQYSEDMKNINDIENTLKEFNVDFNKMWNLLNNLYIKDKEYRYIKFSVKEIEEILKTRQNSLNEIDINVTEKILAKINSNIKILDKKIANRDFKKLDSAIEYIIRELLKIKKRLNINFKSSEFFNRNKKIFTEALEILIFEQPRLDKIFEKIYNNFSGDIEFNKNILKAKIDLSRISKEAADFISESNKNKYDATNLLTTAKKIIEKILTWSDTATMLVKDVDNKYSYSKTIINSITASKLLLTQINAFLSVNNNINKNIIGQINRLMNDLNNIEHDFFSDSNKNFEYNYNKLLETNQEISAINIYAEKSFYLKKYVEKIIFFMNLQMAKKDNLRYDFQKPIDLYKQGLYFDSVQNLIRQLKSFT